MEQFIPQNLWIIILLVLWQIPWKGYALWKAARLGDKWWFIALLVIQTLAILDIFYIFVFSKTDAGAVKISGAEGLIEKQAREKEENLRKILRLFTTRERLANNDVENLLGVSDATATNYLEDLERRGAIEQLGAAGRGVRYRLKKG